uniref:Uncharacterized protein n=1 Tax=Panagrolaimus superbus TaxID=310955 RepID=A0A914YIE8_9BILA
MNKSVASGSGTEKKNCNVKKVTISDDIEIVEEDSDGEEEEDVLSDVSTVVESPTKSVTSAAVFEKANQEDIVDSTSAGRTPLSNDITQFLSPINVNKNFDGREKKNSKVKKVIIDDDIEMVEEDSEVEEEDVEESIDSPSKSVESIVALEKEHHGSSSSEKKKCKVKKTIISDDIEFVEEESEEEEEVVSTAEVSANSPNKLVTTSDAISRNSNQDHIISTNNVSISDVPFDMPRKIQMIKR